MSKKKLFWFAVIGLAVFGTAVYALVQSQNSNGKAGKLVDVGQVKTMSLEASIFTTGRVLAEDERNVFSEVSVGKIDEIAVKEGQIVKKGAVLAKLATADMDEQIKSARIQLRIAQENLSQLKSSGRVNFDLALKSAETAYADAQKSYADKTALYASGAISLAEKDLAKTTLDRVQTELEAAKRNYSNYGKESQIKIQSLSVEAAENTLNQLLKNKEKMTIKAPIDGIVYKVNGKVGDQISMTIPLFSLSTVEKLQVQCNVSEFDVDQIKLGQEAIVKGDGFDDVYRGEISYISPVAESVLNGQTSETVVKIKISLKDKQTKFKPNFSASVEIKTAAVTNATTLPYEAVYTTKEGQKQVFVVKEGKVAVNNIKTGVEGDIVVEVLGSSLADGDQVILNPTEDLKDGDAVKVISAGDKK